jgi:hypothetical protein
MTPLLIAFIQIRKPNLVIRSISNRDADAPLSDDGEILGLTEDENSRQLDAARDHAEQPNVRPS